MNEQKFFEVFPSLALGESLHKILNDAVVTHLSMNSSRTTFRVSLRFSRLVGRKLLDTLEKEMVRQIQPFSNTVVHIQDEYQLSELYNARNTFEEYYDSFLYILEKNDVLASQLLRSADISFTSDHEAIIQANDNMVTRRKMEGITEFLSDTMLHKFGFALDFTLSYEKTEKNRHMREAEHRVERMVEEISRNAYENTPGEMAIPDGVEPSVAEDKALPKDANASKATTEATKKDHTNKLTSSTNADASNKDKAKSGYAKESSRTNASSGERTYRRPIKRSENPDVIYGRDIIGEPIRLEEVTHEMGEIVFRGQILNMDSREIRSGNIIVMFDVTDFTDTITVKMFLNPDSYAELKGELKVNGFFLIKGITTIDRYSGELTIGTVSGMMKIADFRVKRKDLSMEKRVELHCHTKMSELDAVSDAGAIIKQAISWGMPALAITDHGVVQSFTEAYHAIQKVKDSDFKVIYGVEAYLVDDLNKIIRNSKGQSLEDTYVAFDIETTGFSPVEDTIIEIGAVKVTNGNIVDRFETFINPLRPIPFRIEELTSINDAMVVNAPVLEEVLPKFLEFIDGAVLVAHNAEFDVSFIKEKSNQLHLPEQEYTVVDTVSLSHVLLPNMGRYKLDTVAKALKINLGHHHRAVDDAECCCQIFLKLADRLRGRNISNLDEVNSIEEFTQSAIRKSKSYHAILLATNELGRVNLYRLVSMSHLKYFSMGTHKVPLIPKSELDKHREGLILGSACEAGELFQAVVRGASEAEITRLVNYYDYLEIQPIGNNQFMLADTRNYDHIKTEEDLQNLNRTIVELGDKFHKPVVATCDVHFLNPEDEIYRRIIQKGQGFPDADRQPPLYLRTTEEMLKEFAYLGEDKAYEVVVTNTRKIADYCDRIEPVRPDKCPPVIPHSDETLRTICYTNAHKLYGPNLPQIVVDRLEKELNSIISNGYSVMYIIAQKLVWKSNEDGYLVGSRGSVGSSFVATMSGITEVNPLSPHYLCPNCYYVDFDSEEVKAFSGGAGCDMPDKICPKCQTKLRKEGFDIPFETFLGFYGDKEPDIDLNFSGEYQAKAHAYTEVIFGEGQTFKAGTVGTLADKTVFGYVRKYFEEKNAEDPSFGRKRECELNRLVAGGVGVKRSTGQHPGGIIVLPYGEDIDSFTPVQHPANDMTTNIVTTHFDYHSIDHNLLKLDILGHDDPTMIRMLQDLTKLNPTEIPLDSPEVMSLFQSTEALGIKPEDIGGTKLGCLGIPEFGTDFAMGMLIETKPQHFSDLVRIAGLSHGTDVWLGNAQELISSGQATISTAICTRDDIMTYLIHMGVEAGMAFNIMENVRKGKVAKGGCDKWPGWKEEMKAHGVPDWYTKSCEKIQYMFPKAHAAAYVMMAWRVAYCKVFYPLEYYCAYFSIRADNFNYEKMCFGRAKLDAIIEDYKSREKLSPKEDGELKDMRLVQEMYARGIEFMPIDVFRSHSRNFQIVEGKLLPPFKSIDGLGEAAADGIYEAAKGGPFLSKQDFITRSKVSKNNADDMARMGILSGLPETNQLSLFDYMNVEA